MKTLNISVAMAKNQVIGCNNQLPWDMPADLQRFRQLTLNKTVIMGRKTFESIGHALPDRENIVITQQENYRAENCKIVHSLEDAVLEASHKKIFVIGGQAIYEQALQVAQHLFITLIDAVIDGDVFFPEIEKTKWQLVSREKHKGDEKNPYDYEFLIYRCHPAA
jgi:dihydrofolate reductase